MYLLPVSNIDGFKRFASVIKKHLGVKLSLVQENLAKTFGFQSFHAAIRFAAERKEAQQSNSAPTVLSAENVRLWMEQLEETFGTEVLAVFERRSHEAWLMTICALSQSRMDHDDVEIPHELDSEILNEPLDVSSPVPVVTVKRRRKIEFP
jgi:hypothetical protein